MLFCFIVISSNIGFSGKISSAILGAGQKLKTNFHPAPVSLAAHPAGVIIETEHTPTIMYRASKGCRRPNN